MKPFLTIPEQIDLIDSRNMSILGNPKAYQFLLRKNYFNTISVYGKIFMSDVGQNKFKDGSTFDEIMNSYYFDKDIREITLKMSLEVEANISSTISYYFCEAFPEEYNYLNIKNFRTVHLNEFDKNRFLDQFVYFQSQVDKFFKRNYNPNKTLNTPIEHYMNKYNHIPLWVMINEFTIGDLCTFFELLDYSLQETIAKCFAKQLSSDYCTPIKFYRYEMLNYMEAIRDLRNRAAHDNSLVYFRTKNNVLYNDFLHPLHSINKRQGRQTYYHSMITMQMFLSKSNFLYFQKSIAKKIRGFERTIPSVDINTFISLLGFKNNWHNQPHLQNRPKSKQKKLRRSK